jgi:hypothetical protein
MVKKTKFDWLLNKLKTFDKVASTECINDHILKIFRKDGETLTVSITPSTHINLELIAKWLQAHDTDFILHSKKEAVIDGEVYDYMDSQQKVLGGYGDIFRVLGQDHNWPYTAPEVSFILRGLRQHTNVSEVRRLDNKRYEIERHLLETVTVIALNEYDMSVEAVRSAVDQYGPFDAILKSNPNGRITDAALEVAESLDLKIFWWRELLRNLNFKWSWRLS